MYVATPEIRTPVGLTIKICLAGDAAVGKTSLVRRFVSDTFDETYAMTLGAKVSSRKYRIEDPRSPGSKVDVGATIWDIMGHVGFRELMKDAFFRGVQGVLLVCDGTRPDTLQDLDDWWRTIRSVAGTVPTIVLVNKSDLTANQKVEMAEVERFAERNGWPRLRTSAKTGENVETAFTRVAQIYLKSVRESGASRF